jgi:hypothetical protein
MEVYGWRGRKILSLKIIEIFVEVKCRLLEDGNAADDEVAIGRVVRVSGLVKVEDVQGKNKGG